MTASEGAPKKKFFKCASCFSSGQYCTHQKNSSTKTGRSNQGGGSGKKFFKCRECYSSGTYCTHSGGSPSTGQGVRSKPPVKKRAAVKTKSKKKLPDAEKVSISVMDDANREVAEVIPLNGVRVRGVRLTNPWIIDDEAKRFAGKVCWRGVTEFLRYEFNAAGPFLHRRIMFQSARGWLFPEIRDLSEGEGDLTGWARAPCVAADDPLMGNELVRLFGQNATVRDCFFGKVLGKGIEVIEDRRKGMKGDDAGVRKSKKFWNGFGKSGNGQVTNYVANEDGKWVDRLADDGKSRNIYLVDLFHYGIKGLDVPVKSGSCGKKRNSDGDASPLKKKKAKGESDDVEVKMEDLEISSDYSVIGEGVGGRELEQPLLGIVNIFSEMRLYWYEPRQR